MMSCFREVTEGMFSQNGGRRVLADSPLNGEDKTIKK